MKVYKKIYHTIRSYLSTAPHRATLSDLQQLQHYLPSGSGFDIGTTIVLDHTPNRIQLYTEYHHIDDVGYYIRWTTHKIYVYPDFISEISIRATGFNYNNIKNHIYETFYDALTAEIPI